MTKKDLKILNELTFDTLAHIALLELENQKLDKNKQRNVYYDIVTRQASIDEVDAKDGLEIRPLRTRLLKNGHRMITNLSTQIADSIIVAMETRLKEDQANDN